MLLRFLPGSLPVATTLFTPISSQEGAGLLVPVQYSVMRGGWVSWGPFGQLRVHLGERNSQSVSQWGRASFHSGRKGSRAVNWKRWGEMMVGWWSDDTQEIEAITHGFLSNLWPPSMEQSVTACFLVDSRNFLESSGGKKPACSVNPAVNAFPQCESNLWWQWWTGLKARSSDS